MTRREGIFFQREILRGCRFECQLYTADFWVRGEG